MSRLTTALQRYSFLALIYLLLVFLLPANKLVRHEYNLSVLGYHALLLIVVLPLAAIWFGAFYSYARLQQYNRAIASSPEGKDFKVLTRGFIWLAWGSAISSILSLVFNAIANAYPGFLSASIIIANYLSLIVPLIGYSLISSASRGLSLRAKVIPSGPGAKRLILFFLFLGVGYCYVTFQRLNLHSYSGSDNPYYLPTLLMVLTVVIPYLYTWFIGLLAAYEMYLYSKHVQGLLYKQAIRLLSYGVVAVIASSITVQYLHSITPRVGHLSLNVTLVLINVVYIFMAIGYILFSLGARQLRKIEEV
jgi:hypothetical protein